MADVKWIKIVTDIFDDEKVLLIESLPGADSIIVIWFKLLCLAGKNNNSGVFLLNDKIPYTDEMLATIFRREVNTVRLALTTFEQYGMIEIVDNVITIPNWSKHQTLDQIEERKDYMKEYMRNRRAKQKELIECKVNSKPNSKVNSKPNSKVNVNSLDKNKIREEKEEDKKDKKHKYGSYEHVLLTDDEMNKLINELGEAMYSKCITFLDEYIEMKGYKAKNHYLVIKKWVVDAVKEKEQKSNHNKTGGIDWSNV